MKHYGLLEVGEYWIVDFEARILEQYALRTQKYERVGVFSDYFAPELFPGLRISLAQVFKGPGF